MPPIASLAAMRQPRRTIVHHARAMLLAGACGLLLSACGGGSDGCTTIDPDRAGSLPACGTATVTQPSMTVALTDANGATITNLVAGRSGILTATVKNASGGAVAGALVAFVATDAAASFTPVVGTALSDANGKASIAFTAGSAAGAYGVTATTTVGTTTVTATVNYSVTVP